MYVLPLITACALLVSLCADRHKTVRAAKIAMKKLWNITPAFVTVLVLTSVVLFFVPDRTISYYLANDDKWVGVGIATFFGSITLMPGFIAYPLCGILLSKGVSHMVLAAFSTTLMMVGVLTYPIERAYFGIRVTILRNLIGLAIALVVTVIIGLFYGELAP